MEIVLWQEGTPFRNAYALRNELAERYAADSRYVLHLNNDVTGLGVGGDWLRELVSHAEARPQVNDEARALAR